MELRQVVPTGVAPVFLPFSAAADLRFILQNLFRIFSFEAPYAALYFYVRMIICFIIRTTIFL